MKIFNLSLCVLFAFYLAGLSVDARTFTDVRDRKIEASIISVSDGQVELKMDKGGKIYKVSVSKFIKADQEYIKLWQKTKADNEKSGEKKDSAAEAKRKKLRDLLRKSKPLKLDEIVINKEIWKMSTSDFAKKYEPNGFVYMSASKQDLRAAGKGFSLFGKNAGEVVVRTEGGHVASVLISLYNRGDDGSISMALFNGAYNGIIRSLTDKTGVTPSDEGKTGTVKLTRQLWEWENSIILLEKSLSSDGGRPEFLRVKMKSEHAKSQGMANRSSLRNNVVRDKATGDIYIKGVPMVDQGRKGYCAVASAARVYQYYGLDIDQHELAQIAGTGPNSGTSLGEMVASLKKVTRHVRSRVLVMYEFPKGSADKMPGNDSSYQDYDRMIRNYNLGLKEFARDIKNYNKIAKKKGKTVFASDYETGVVHMETFARKCDPSIYREVMTKKSSFSRFQSKIEEYIDQGLPVGWCLQLGMFKEGDMPQNFGGHMRLITGYNSKTKEIIYTDSWGHGHGKKRMPLADAFCMSNALLALPPTK